MPVQAIPQALVASLYPLGLAMLLLLAAAARPRARAVVFLVGAIACMLAIGFVVVFALHGAGLGRSSQHSPRYGVRLALGVLLLIAALVLARRPPRPRGEPSRWTRRAREGGLIAAFVVGILLYLPSPAYLAALEQVGSSKLSTVALIGWVILVAGLALITLLVPALLFLLAPEWTVPKLQLVDGWLARHRRTLLVSALAVLGLWETVDALIGLLSLRRYRQYRQQPARTAPPPGHCQVGTR